MIPEIKQRIEQIRRGEVPKGYKKTRTDVVPEEWENVAIGDYIVEFKEKTTVMNQYPVLTSSRNGLMLQTDYYANRQVTTENNIGYNVLPRGYVTFRSRSDDGRFRFNENTIIEKGIVSYFYPVFTFRENICKGFILQLLNETIYRRMYPYAEGTAQQVLSLNKLSRLVYSIPRIAEQRKIVAILATQDQIVELQILKIDELKRLKRTYLSKMIPKKGCKMPELRFKGFTDTWEQRKLKDICSVFADGDWIESKDQSDQGVRLIQTGNIGVTEFFDKLNNKKWVSDETFERLHCTEVLSGDILISRLPEPAGRACIIPNIGQKMITAVDCTIARIAPEYCSEYVVQYLSTQGYFDEVNNCLAGGTRQRISRGNLSSFLIPLPCSKAEQKQIGSFFRSLDDLIALHQRKLNEMKKFKKALLQLLLTGIVRVEQ